jgi:hypothetical protein
MGHSLHKRGEVGGGLDSVSMSMAFGNLNLMIKNLLEEGVYF